MISLIRRRDAVAPVCRAGFTLLELLVVIVIIGLLAAYVGPKYFSQLSKSEVTIVKAQIESFEKALDTYRLDVGRYPTADEGLSSLMTAPAGAGSRWNGPYLKKGVPQDPWALPILALGTPALSHLPENIIRSPQTQLAIN